MEAPLTATAEGTVPSPYTSFDAVNGPVVLAGAPDWNADMYITHALAVANLPGTPIARFLQYELVDFPGPQIAITQDHGPQQMRAIVCDFRPLKGKVEVIDATFTASVLDLVQASQSLPDSSRALQVVTGIACTTLVDRIIVPPAQIRSPNADLVLFQLWRDGVPLNTWRPFVLGDARPPVPPIPHDAVNQPTLPAQHAQARYTGASSSRPAAIPRYAPAHLPAPESRYSYLDTLEGVQNRPKPPSGTDAACQQDALENVPRRGTPLHARIILRPLAGLYLPQVLLSRVSHRAGWQTIAIDLRAINLGIKVADVVLGTSIRQLLNFDSPFRTELALLGRGDIPFAFLLNQEPCVIDAAFHMQTDTLTLLPPAHGPQSTSSEPSQAAPARWTRTLHAPPSQAVSLDQEDSALFTVYDVVHHYRIMRRGLTDSLDVLIAAAISSTPEISDAVGHVVLHEIAELPSPQIILASRQRPCCFTRYIPPVFALLKCRSKQRLSKSHTVPRKHAER